MTNINLSRVLAIVDRSGSMTGIKKDTEGGLASFITEQAKVPGVCKVDLVEFDDAYNRVYTNIDAREVPKYRLQPRGLTALHDAIGRAVTELGTELARTPESQRPGTVSVVVLTDGFENHSREWTAESLKKLIEQQQSVYGWTFSFLGSNQDAVLTGSELGFSPDFSLTYTGENVAQAFASTSNSISTYRGSVAAGLSNGEAILRSGYTDADRAEAVSTTK